RRKPAVEDASVVSSDESRLTIATKLVQPLRNCGRQGDFGVRGQTKQRTVIARVQLPRGAGAWIGQYCLNCPEVAVCIELSCSQDRIDGLVFGPELLTQPLPERGEMFRPVKNRERLDLRGARVQFRQGG